MIVVFGGPLPLVQPVFNVAQFSGDIIGPPAPQPPAGNFYIDNCLVRRDDSPKYGYN